MYTCCDTRNVGAGDPGQHAAAGQPPNAGGNLVFCNPIANKEVYLDVHLL
jgi:hypothetical protein